MPKVARYETKGANGKPHYELGIFEGVPLQESDALHSHLTSIAPFDTLNLDDKQTAVDLRRTIESWVSQGMGAWNSTSLPFVPCRQNGI